MRHVISELAKHVPDDIRKSELVCELAVYGCPTRMHVVRLLASRVGNESHLKDIDFSPSGIRALEGGPAVLNRCGAAGDAIAPYCLPLTSSVMGGAEKACYWSSFEAKLQPVRTTKSSNKIAICTISC